MIIVQEHIVMEGVYFTEAGFEISPTELTQLVSRGKVPVFKEDGTKIGDVIQVRRVDRCLEALMEVEQ